MSSSIQRFYSIADLRSHAKKRLPKAVFDFFDGGAEDELTLQRNVKAFQEKRLIILRSCWVGLVGCLVQ